MRPGRTRSRTGTRTRPRRSCPPAPAMPASAESERHIGVGDAAWGAARCSPWVARARPYGSARAANTATMYRPGQDHVLRPVLYSPPVPSRATGKRTADGHSIDPLTGFSDATRNWFRSSFEAPTPAQAQGWPAIAAGQPTLLFAPPGSGKTLAAFLWCIDRLMSEPAPEDAQRRLRVLYVSPLKALVHDVNRNLRSPLAGIGLAARKLGGDGGDGVGPGEAPGRELTVGMRTGDTPAEE